MTHESGQVKYVVIPYFLFMEAMVSSLINGENIPYVWNPCCVPHFTVLWARIRMGHVCLSFARNPMLSLRFICFYLCVAIHLMDRIEVMVSCMIFREPMSLLKPLYRVCVGMESYDHSGMHSSSVYGLYVDSSSRDAAWSSIFAYPFPGLHLHFYLSTPLPDIVIFCSPLHDFHVLMESSVTGTNLSLNFNLSITHLDFNCQGLPSGVCAGHFWNSEIVDWKAWKLW